MQKHAPPQFQCDAFNCPYCLAFAHQNWPKVFLEGSPDWAPIQDVSVSVCSRCSRRAVWYSSNLVYPRQSSLPHASEDMPREIAADYEEARNIFDTSPRSSAALLRLAVQKLCVNLGQPGKNLNDDIGALVKQGLPERVQKALDIVRVVGNNQVHPGTLDVRDDPETAVKLFGLLNLIVEAMISTPKRVDAIFESLPNGAKQQIANRDGSKTANKTKT